MKEGKGLAPVDVITHIIQIFDHGRIEPVRLKAQFTADRAMQAGMDHCMVKPFNADQLFEMIQSYSNNALDERIEAMLEEREEEEESWDELLTLDTQNVLKRFRKSGSSYPELLRDFLENLPERIAEIQAAFKDEDYQTLSGKAHNLKGVSASLGAKRLSYLAQKLDQQYDKIELVSVQKIISEIDIEVIAIGEEITRFLESHDETKKNS